MSLFSEYIIGSKDENLLTSNDNESFFLIQLHNKCNSVSRMPNWFFYELKLKNTAPSFTDTAIPDIIVCPVRAPCGVPFIITGPPGQV